MDSKDLWTECIVSTTRLELAPRIPVLSSCSCNGCSLSLVSIQSSVHRKSESVLSNQESCHLQTHTLPLTPPSRIHPLCLLPSIVSVSPQLHPSSSHLPVFLLRELGELSCLFWPGLLTVSSCALRTPLRVKSDFLTLSPSSICFSDLLLS